MAVLGVIFGSVVQVVCVLCICEWVLLVLWVGVPLCVKCVLLSLAFLGMVLDLAIFVGCKA